MRGEIRQVQNVVFGCEHQFVALDGTTLSYQAMCLRCGQIERRVLVVRGQLWCRFCGYSWEGLNNLGHDVVCAVCKSSFNVPAQAL